MNIYETMVETASTLSKLDIMNIKYSREEKYKCVRYYIFHLLYQQGFTLQSIGKMAGYNHATIINALKLYDNAREFPDSFSQMTNTVKQLNQLL